MAYMMCDTLIILLERCTFSFPRHHPTKSRKHKEQGLSWNLHKNTKTIRDKHQWWIYLIIFSVISIYISLKSKTYLVEGMNKQHTSRLKKNFRSLKSDLHVLVSSSSSTSSLLSATRCINAPGSLEGSWCWSCASLSSDSSRSFDCELDEASTLGSTVMPLELASMYLDSA